MNLLSLQSTFVTFWQSLATFANFSHLFFGNPWQLLEIFCQLVISSYFHLIILSSCHHVLFSSVSLIACKFVSLSIYQFVNLLACKLVSFSACASWSLLLFSQTVMSKQNFLIFPNRNGEKENSRIYFPKQKWPDIRFETFYFRKQ